MYKRKLLDWLFRVGDMSPGRIEALSDGVFAIVMTLLVLEIHVPHVTGPNISAALAQNLLAMTPKLLSYVLSFAIVCIWWVAHHHLFNLIKRSDRGLLWLNPALHLIAVALAYKSTRLAIVLYVAIPLLYFLPSKLERHTLERTAHH